MNYYLKKMIAFLIILILIITPLASSQIDKAVRSNCLKFFKSNDSNSSLIYIEVSSPYDYGLRAGKAFKNLYITLYLITHGSREKIFKEQDLSRQLEDIKQHSPYFIEELKGLSESLNIKMEQLVSLHMSLSSFLKGSCTTTLSTGEATKNNETFLTQNLDSSSISTVIFWRLLSRKCWIVRIAPSNYKYAFWGIPVVYEIPFLNEKGLGFGGNAITLTENESRYIDEGPGISTYALERLSMRTCKDVKQVANLWKNSNRSSGTNRKWPHFWDNSASVWCDREGGILMIEQTHNYIITVFGNSTDITQGSKDILWHANHHQWLDPNKTGSICYGENKVANCSYMRAARAHTLLEENYGNITLWTCKKITRDHDGGTKKNRRDSYDICGHPDRNLFVFTIFSWIVVPKDLKVYWTHGSPCRSIFHERDFSLVFREKFHSLSTNIIEY